MTTTETTPELAADPYCVQLAGLPGVYRVRSTDGAEALIQRESGGWSVLYGFDPGVRGSRHEATLPGNLYLSEAARGAVELLDRGQ